MTPTSIILLLLGISFLVLSFFLVDHSKKTENSDAMGEQKKEVALTEEESEKIKSQIRLLLEEECSNCIIDADDQMSKITNEKIIAINDFSNQILEKIENNHKEAVFLYDMLNQKEEEIKVTFSKMETIRRENKEFLEKLSAMMAGRTKAKEQTAKKEEVKETLHQASELKTKVSEQREEAAITITESDGNRNDEILKLHQQSKSILEISKQLGIGQGEVKLIIDLYANK